jgi:chlorite dismutase
VAGTRAAPRVQRARSQGRRDALSDDLSELRALQTDVAATAAAPAISLDWSYLSLTEGSEYTSTPDRYREEMAEKGLVGDELDRRVEQFAERMEKYTEAKLHPQMPADWQLLCFYPMSHRREGDDNWYALDYEERKRLMAEHGKSGRAYTRRWATRSSASWPRTCPATPTKPGPCPVSGGWWRGSQIRSTNMPTRPT